MGTSMKMKEISWNIMMTLWNMLGASWNIPGVSYNMRGTFLGLLNRTAYTNASGDVLTQGLTHTWLALFVFYSLLERSSPINLVEVYHIKQTWTILHTRICFIDALRSNNTPPASYSKAKYTIS